MNSVQDHINKVRNSEIDIVEATHKAIEEAKRIDRDYYYMNVISEKLAVSQAENL